MSPQLSSIYKNDHLVDDENEIRVKLRILTLLF